MADRKAPRYQEKIARDFLRLTRDVLRDLPGVCGSFIRSLESTTTPLTRLAYARDLKAFFGFLSREIPAYGALTLDGWTDEILASVKADHIEQYLEYLSYYVTEHDEELANGELGKMRKLSTLRSFYKYLFKSERIPADVCALVDMPKRHQKPILRLEVDEVAKLLDLAETGDAFEGHQKRYTEHTRLRDLTILTLFLGTGIRVSECVGLNIDDLDFEIGGFLITRKGGNQVILYFPREVEDQIRAYLMWRVKQVPLPGHEGALFLSLQMKRMSVRAMEYMVKKYALAVAPLKRRLSPHKLRSTFGTNLYRETGDIYLVADVLGHSDVNTTKRHYADMSDDRRRRAAKAVTLRDDAPVRMPDDPRKDDAP